MHNCKSSAPAWKLHLLSHWCVLVEQVFNGDVWVRADTWHLLLHFLVSSSLFDWVCLSHVCFRAVLLGLAKAACSFPGLSPLRRSVLLVFVLCSSVSISLCSTCKPTWDRNIFINSVLPSLFTWAYVGLHSAQMANWNSFFRGTSAVIQVRP